MADVGGTSTVLYSLDTATVPETSSPYSNDWASIRRVREPGRKVDSHGAEKECSSEHSYLEVPETQRDEGCVTDTDAPFQLGIFQDIQIDGRDSECLTASHSERYDDAPNASDLNQLKHPTSLQIFQGDVSLSDCAFTSSTPRVSKWSTKSSRPVTSERQEGTEHDITQAEPHRDQSDGLANELCTAEYPSSRSDAMEVDTNSPRIRHDRNGADDLTDTASGPPTPSVLHMRKQGAHANIDDSEMSKVQFHHEDHDWPSDQIAEEDATLRSALTDVTIHPLSTSDTGIITATVDDVNYVEHLTDARSTRALLEKLKLSGGLRSIVIRPIGAGKWLLSAIITDGKNMEPLSRSRDPSKSSVYNGRNDGGIQSTSAQARMRRQTPKLSQVEDSMGLDGDEYSIKEHPRVDACPDGRKDGEIRTNAMPCPSQERTTSLPKARRGEWTKREDENLCAWVGAGRSWDQIFRRFPNRTKSAVRSRWHVVLKPRVGCRR